jgi:hypothetical protein
MRSLGALRRDFAMRPFRGMPIAQVSAERRLATIGRRADIRPIEESDMELTSSTVERKASQAHDAVDAAAAKASEKAAPAIDRVARRMTPWTRSLRRRVRRPIGSIRAPSN